MFQKKYVYEYTILKILLAEEREMGYKRLN